MAVSWLVMLCRKLSLVGGYQYRLCPAEKELNEDCFQAFPVPFADGRSSLRWGGAGGERIWFNATDVSVGTKPTGSTWRRGPLPRGPWGWDMWGASYPPVCQESEACLKAHKKPPTPAGHSATEGVAPCKCSGDGNGDFYTMEIVDHLLIPKGTKPGHYVLGWRWGRLLWTDRELSLN